MLVSQELNVACFRDLKLSSNRFAFGNEIFVVIGGHSIVVIICNYKISPITADTIPNAANRLYHVCRSCFGPNSKAPESGKPVHWLLMVEPPGTAPGSTALIPQPRLAS